MAKSPETRKVTDDETDDGFGLRTDSAWDAAVARDRKRALQDLEKLLKNQGLWKKVAGLVLMAALGLGVYNASFTHGVV